MLSCRTPTHSYTSCVCRSTRSPPVVLSPSDRYGATGKASDVDGDPVQWLPGRGARVNATAQPDGRTTVTIGTVNLALYLDFNDGKGTVASEVMQSQHMEATWRERPPSWVATDLELTPSAEITTSVFAVSTREDAAKTCKTFGIHLTSFDGLSFEMFQPGTYDVYRVADFSVQMLFLPCPHAYRCRRLVEVSLRTNDFTFAVQILDDDQLPVSVLVKSCCAP